MRTLIASCALSLLTAGCLESNPVRPQDVVEVRMPIPVPCVDKVPDIPKTVMPDPDASDRTQLIAGAASDVYELSQYSRRIHALLWQCANQPEAP